MMILKKQLPVITRVTKLGEFIIKIRDVDVYDKPEHVSELEMDILFIKNNSKSK